MSVGLEQAELMLGTRISAARRLGVRANARLSGAITDFILADDLRLDEETRVEWRRVLRSMVLGIATDVRRHAARVLAGKGADEAAERVLREQQDVVRRLSHAGLLHDRLLMDETLAQVRCDMIAEGLLPSTGDPEQPSLLVRLADVDDAVVAVAARALLTIEARRRAAGEHGGVPGNMLPPERHRHLVWWIAATIREEYVADAGNDGEVDRALVEAAQRNLAAHDGSERPEAAAVRLAAAIDARPDELGSLLIDALGDRRLLLFIAVLAHAAGMDFDAARQVVLEPEGDRLWLALRAIGLDRSTIAHIALALAEADPRRDIEAFADGLDAIIAVPLDNARSALAPLTLHHDLRRAINALAREAER